MPFEMKSNPLENNALFAAPETLPEKKPVSSKKKPAAAAKKTTPAVKPAKQEIPAEEPESTEYIRATFIVRKDLLRRLKDYAYTDRREIKEVINEFLEKALDKVEADYEKRGETLLHVRKSR